MVDEAVRTNGIFVPYPLLAIMLTLTLVLGGGLIGLYATVTTMNSTMLMRDADQKEAIKELKNQLQLQEMYTHDIRETLAARGELKKKTSGN